MPESGDAEMRGSLTLLALSTALWVAAFVSFTLGLPLAGTWSFSLYHLYGLAVFGGWLCGNLFVRRLGHGRLTWSPLVLYLFGPPGALFLLYSLAAAELHEAAPLAPVFAFGAYAVLFFVPLSFRR